MTAPSHGPRRPGSSSGAHGHIDVTPPRASARSYRKRRRHATRHLDSPVARVLGTTLAAVVGFGLVYVQTLSDQFESAVNSQDVSSLIDELPDQPDKPVDPATGGEPLNIVVIGSDDRSGDNADIGGHFEGMRNDATMLVHISADRSRIDIVSIPRDAVVAVPDCRLNDGTVVNGWTGKFNIAFNNGGKQGDPAEAAACVINTIQSISQVPIDHFMVVDFTGFEAMIDALGGVPMCVPERIVGIDVDLELDAGSHLFDGETALAYARLRKASEGDVSGSDLQRITRQQDLVLQTIRTAQSKNLLTDTGQLTQFLRAGAESLTMDEEFAQTDYLLSLAYSVSGIDSDNITFTTVPWEYSEDFTDVLILPEAEQLWDDLRNDRPITVADNDSTSATWDSGRDTHVAVPTDATVDDLLDECQTQGGVHDDATSSL